MADQHSGVVAEIRLDLDVESIKVAENKLEKQVQDVMMQQNILCGLAFFYKALPIHR